MTANAMGLDDFLGHKTRSSNKSQFIRSWKKASPPVIDTWMNVQAPIIAVWQHNWPKVVEREVDDEKVLEVWGSRWNSWETEEVLRRQYKRDKETGVRTMPPVVCPMSILLEEIYDLIIGGKLSWVESLFLFEGSDPASRLVLHAGGMVGMFSKKDMSAKEKKELKKARIFLKESYRENMMARCNYLFRVVDNDEPEAGVQIALETTLLGDKVKKVIRDRMTGKGHEDGHPFKNPYCIRWEYKPKELVFSDKYNAIIMEKIKLTDEIDELIHSDPPDVASLIKPGNIKELRTSMENHYIGPDDLFDWDYIFERAENVAEEMNSKPFYEDEDAMPEELNRSNKSKKKVSKKKKVLKKKKAVKKEQVECDVCNELMDADESVCPHCDHDYDEDPNPKPKKKKSKKVLKRGTAKKGKSKKTSGRWSPPF